jgi:hypothetical protein
MARIPTRARLLCDRVFPRLTDRAAETEGRLSQGRYPAADLSSFRIYLGRFSAGYDGFRSGRTTVLSETGPRFPLSMPGTLRLARIAQTTALAAREHIAAEGDHVARCSDMISPG